MWATADAEREPTSRMGVKDRLDTLYRTHGNVARRLAYLMTGDRYVAEDLVQDAFVRLFRRYADLRADHDIAAYMRRTVVNLAIDHHRKKSRETDYIQKQRIESEHSMTATIDHQDQLWQALQSVSPRVRAALVLRYYEDLSEQQTADVMGCSVGAVKSYASRGLKKLREQMEGDDV